MALAAAAAAAQPPSITVISATASYQRDGELSARRPYCYQRDGEAFAVALITVSWVRYLITYTSHLGDIIPSVHHRWWSPLELRHQGRW